MTSRLASGLASVGNDLHAQFGTLLPTDFDGLLFLGMVDSTIAILLDNLALSRQLCAPG